MTTSAAQQKQTPATFKATLIDGVLVIRTGSQDAPVVHRIDLGMIGTAAMAVRQTENGSADIVVTEPGQTTPSRTIASFATSATAAAALDAIHAALLAPGDTSGVDLQTSRGLFWVTLGVVMLAFFVAATNQVFQTRLQQVAGMPAPASAQRAAPNTAVAPADVNALRPATPRPQSMPLMKDGEPVSADEFFK